LRKQIIGDQLQDQKYRSGKQIKDFDDFHC
jgi:hypothetical protein